jgi:hypothetical protein
MVNFREPKAKSMPGKMHQTGQKELLVTTHCTKTRRGTQQLGTDLRHIAPQRVTTGRSVADELPQSRHLIPTGPVTGSTRPHKKRKSTLNSIENHISPK